MSELQVHVTRGSVVESKHHIDFAVVDTEGAVVLQGGDANRPVPMRSAAKPLQALPILLSGAADAFNLSRRELALACASHMGEPYHVETVMGLLKRLGLSAQHLRCGVHPPRHQPSAERLRQAGEKPSPLHNNCSGKHAGMLAVAAHHGWSLDDYENLEHPVQQAILRVLGRLTGLDPAEIPCGRDGCSVPTFALSPVAMARAWSVFAGGDVGTDRDQQAASVIVGAVQAHPPAIAGTDQWGTQIIELTAEPLLAKSGAQGVWCFALPELGLAGALKVRDGGSRGRAPAAFAILDRLAPELLAHLPEPGDDTPVSQLAAHRRPPIHNHRGLQVGMVEAVWMD